MPEFTDDDVTRLAEWVMDGNWTRTTAHGLARHLLEQDVMLPPPPPDPAVVVAEYIWRDCIWDIWRRQRILAAVRDLFPPGALAQAAAKVQEVDRDG